MHFYQLDDNTPYERHWTYAPIIHPRSHVIRLYCQDCGRGCTYPAGAFDVTIEEGSDFPDILQCGEFPFLIISARVLAAWRSHDLGPHLAFPVRVSEALDTDLRPADAPDYFRVEVYGSAQIDIVASHGKITQYCGRCAGFYTEPIVIKNFVFSPGSWDGNAVFRDERLFPRTIFCTDAFKELAEREGYTNFRFDEMRQD